MKRIVWILALLSTPVMAQQHQLPLERAAAKPDAITLTAEEAAAQQDRLAVALTAKLPSQPELDAGLAAITRNASGVFNNVAFYGSVVATLKFQYQLDRQQIADLTAKLAAVTKERDELKVAKPDAPK